MNVAEVKAGEKMSAEVTTFPKFGICLYVYTYINIHRALACSIYIYIAVSDLYPPILHQRKVEGQALRKKGVPWMLR